MGKMQLLIGVFTLASLGSYAQSGKNVTVSATTYETNMDNSVADAKHVSNVAAQPTNQDNDKATRLRATNNQTPAKAEQVPATTVNRRERSQRNVQLQENTKAVK